MSMKNEDAIIQALMELSGQMSEMNEELKAEIHVVQEDVKELKEKVVQLDDKVETVDAKIDVLSQSLIKTQADVLRLKRA